jgi:hypothetical protein
MGRPRKAIDTDKLFELASQGLRTPEIAALLECSPDTLERNHAEELAEGKFAARAKILQKQMELALAGNVTMLIWVGKNLCGQADKSEVTGKDGEPLYRPIDREELIGKLLGPGKPAVKPSVQ